MNKFIIEQDFWDLFPEAKFAVLLAKSIDNSGASRSAIQMELAKANQSAARYFTEDVFSENPAVAVWRAAYQKFKTKKGARSSIENLLKRVSKGNVVGTINPLVDCYNAVSLTFGLPAGGEDLDTFVGDMRLTRAVGGENFVALGDAAADAALPGEVAYLDEAGAVCRCWNWRDGQRTMLTDATKNAFLIIESCEASQSDAVDGATEMLTALLKQYFAVEPTVAVLDVEHRELVL